MKTATSTSPTSANTNTNTTAKAPALHVVAEHAAPATLPPTAEEVAAAQKLEAVAGIRKEAALLGGRLKIVSPKPELDASIDANEAQNKQMERLSRLRQLIKSLEEEEETITADLKGALQELNAGELVGRSGRYVAESIAASVSVKEAGVRYVFRA